jgi:aspartate aminotransferase
VKNFGGVLSVVPPSETFIPDPEAFAGKINDKTKAVIINNPNNPTGVVYSEEDIIKLADVLRAKEKEYGNAIYLIADEPYRELVYDGLEVPYLTKYYDDTIVGYSYSKSLSLPGERIGYLVIPNEVDDYENVVQAANVANRILGFVNAPSLIQRTVAKCLDAEVDVAAYNRNRELLYKGLTDLGFECIKPQGAFYMYVKALGGDDKAFAAKAKEFNLLLVPGSTFYGPGYVRIAYCVDHEMIKRSMEAFEKLANAYK